MFSSNNWRETSVKQLYKSAFVKFFAAVKKTDIDCSSSSHAVGVHLIDHPDYTEDIVIDKE